MSKKTEILAPAGTMEAVHAVLEAGADAVYVGGRGLNMRMHRAGYGLDGRQMAEAIALAHEFSKKARRLYVTVNSLVVGGELGQVRSTLEELGRLAPDALIVQDLAVAAIAREVCAHIPLHASTMMNVHSVESAQTLKRMGFRRVIASRDIPLHEVARIGQAADMEMEVFIHGDMCICHSSQCYASGILFGESSNRGRCLKNCRWQWRLMAPPGVTMAPENSQGYLLARKDLCLYGHLPELVQFGIASLKIEGRMRPPEFLAPLVSAYRRAVDAYCADPAQYRADPGAMADLLARRVRDFSTCLSFYNPGASSVDTSGAREPRFFSTAKPEPGATIPVEAPEASGAELELIVHVSSPQAAQAAVEAGADAVYLGGDAFVGRESPLDPEWLREFARKVGPRGVRLAVLGTRIADQRDLAEWRWLLKALSGVSGLSAGVSSLGALQAAREMGMHGILADFSLNVANSAAAEELATLGATGVTAALELSFDQLREFVPGCRLPVEVVGQGPLPAMIMEHCVIAAAGGHTRQDACPMDCRRGPWALRDTAEQDHLLLIDRRCRNHLLMAKDVCVLPHLGRLAGIGVRGVRLEAQLDAPDAVATVTSAYRAAMDAPSAQGWDWHSRLEAIRSATGRPLGEGPFAFPESVPADLDSLSPQGSRT